MEKGQLKEQKNHGTPAFPLAFYEWNGDGKAPMLLHWHEEMEIVYLEKGTFTFRYDMEEYLVNAPALLFIQAGHLHQITLEEEQKESAIVFQLDMLSFQQEDEIQCRILEPLLRGELLFPIMITKGQEEFEPIVEFYLQCVQAVKENCLASHLRLKSYLLAFVAYCYEHHLFVAGTKQDEGMQRMKEILQYIKEHYQRKITVKELADIAGMNPQYFCRFFKKHTGKTAISYINELRLEKSKVDLLFSKDKVIDIAANHGFENIGYFMKCFRQYTKMTPQQYREENQKNDKKSK